MNIAPDARDRFTDRVRDYVRFRPSYPHEIITRLKKNLPPGAVVADIGSGTGIFSRLLLEAGFTVRAVEPNRAMRQEAEVTLAGFSGLSITDGDGEHTTLADGSVDAITAAQAFHWFATSAAVTEFSRILVPGGPVFLIWNDRRVDCDSFHREYESLLVRYGTDYSRVNHRNITADFLRSLFDGWACEVFTTENHQDLTLDGLLGRLESSSYCPKRGDPRHGVLMSSIKSLFDLGSAGGVIRMKYECVMFTLRMIAGSGRTE